MVLKAWETGDFLLVDESRIGVFGSKKNLNNTKNRNNSENQVWFGFIGFYILIGFSTPKYLQFDSHIVSFHHTFMCYKRFILDFPDYRVF